MRCNHCGKDFGDGLKCQHCGIDRVEGLGSFNGFNPDTMGSSPLSSGSTTPGGISVTDSKNMLCYSCGEIIPADSEYCPYCQVSQYVYCPKCGYRHLAQYPSCYKCGTNREQYLKQKEEEKREQEIRRKREEEERRKAEERRREEELRRRREEEAERRRVEAIRRAKAEETARKADERRRQAAAEAVHMQNVEYHWFADYIRQNKERLLEKQKKLNKRGIGSIITLVISVIATFSSMAFLDTEFWWLMLVVIGIGVVSCIIAFSTANSEDYHTIEYYILKQYENAHGESASHTHSYVIPYLFERIVVKNEPLNGWNNTGTESEHTIRNESKDSIIQNVPSKSVVNEALFESAFVYLQNMVVDLQHLEGGFESKTWDEKKRYLERYLSDHVLISPATNSIVETVIADVRYWTKPNCLNIDNLGRELIKVFTDKGCI